ncbi:MAG: M20 family metallopeptidase [Acidobacteriia bacterium]|nr:M20 family metallopeptidase [Terriglobia bacterium]
MNLVSYFDANLDEALSLLKCLVEMESYSLDKGGVDRLAQFLAREFENRGAEAEVIPQAASGNALKAVWRGEGSGRPLLFLGHLDTVWPPGTVFERPFAMKDGKAYGPGIYDMKCSLLLCLLVCRAFYEQRLRPERDVIFFFTPDEEIGSAAGLPLFEPIARASRAVLVLEPSLPGGRAKTFRKGVGTFRLRVAGIAAHAGLDPQTGASAILELSRQVLKIQRMTDYERGITLSVGTIRGGSAVNVVPSRAEAEVDFRFSTLADGRRLERRIRRLRPRDARCSFEIEGGINRPPFERTPAVAGLYQEAKALAATIGMQLGEGGTGGGSDGSFTAALGIPTLDGLGVEGGGAHAAHEHILISDVPRRASLLSILAKELLK